MQFRGDLPALVNSTAVRRMVTCTPPESTACVVHTYESDEPCPSMTRRASAYYSAGGRVRIRRSCSNTPCGGQECITLDLGNRTRTVPVPAIPEVPHMANLGNPHLPALAKAPADSLPWGNPTRSRTSIRTRHNRCRQDRSVLRSPGHPATLLRRAPCSRIPGRRRAGLASVARFPGRPHRSRPRRVRARWCRSWRACAHCS